VEIRENLFLAVIETGDLSDERGMHYFLKDPTRGTNTWGSHEVVVDISPTAVYLKIGFSLATLALSGRTISFWKLSTPATGSDARVA
jgi:hypothetical protein